MLEVEEFESLMLNLTKKELKGESGTTSAYETDMDFNTEGGRSFTKDDLFDPRRQAKIE